MESRNIKTIDEHGIDRDANIICGFVADGKKYVLYSIGRDEESDNVFVSGLVDNIDKTSNMVNIDDNAERIKVSVMAKDLITHSLRTESDKSETEIELPGNNKVKIVDVLFNKEQNIDVSKTYIATVKKSVSKVSEDFYKIDLPVSDLSQPTLPEAPKEPVSEVKEESIDEALKTAMPELDLNKPIIEENAPEVEPVPEKQFESLPTPEPTPAPEPEPVPAPIPEPTPEPVSEVKPEPVPEPTVEEKPALGPEATFLAAPEPEVAPSPLPSLEPTPTPAPEPEVTPAPIPEPVPEPVSEVKPEPVPEPTVEEKPALGPEVTITQSPLPVPEPQDSKLLFDASTESNLNKALGEVSEEKVVAAPQDGVESLREFGVDTPSTLPTPTQTEEDVKKLTRSKGFANNKFFMAIAIIFFVLSCVFLGYEAFQYFTMK